MKNQVKITKRWLDGLTNHTKKDTFYRDTELKGFGVKITPTGTVSFIAEARIKHGGSKRTALGRYPLLSVEQARNKAHKVLAQYRDGKDPVQLEREEREREAAEKSLQSALAVTLGSVLDDFLQARRLKSKTEYDYKNTFKHCFEDWRNRPIRDITRKDVEKKFREIQDKGGRSKKEKGTAQANKAMRILHSLFNHAMAEEIAQNKRLIDRNPVEVIKEKRLRKTLKPRSGSIPLHKVGKLLTAAVELENETVGDIITLLLFTGLRRNEALSLRWENVDLLQKYIKIPDTKNGLDHLLPLSAGVQAMLVERKQKAVGGKPLSIKKLAPIMPENPWVFPASSGPGHLIEPRKQIEKLSQEIGVTFTLHDLRRTFASAASAIGIDYRLIKRVMNHKADDITEKYIQVTIEQLRPPMEQISEYIEKSGIENAAA